MRRGHGWFGSELVLPKEHKGLGLPGRQLLLGTIVFWMDTLEELLVLLGTLVNGSECSVSRGINSPGDAATASAICSRAASAGVC
jgi:hypothetical protein